MDFFMEGERIIDRPRPRSLKGMQRALSVDGDLERITAYLDSHFEGLNLKDLPEYQAAVDSIRRYVEKAVAHFESEYKKREERLSL